MRFSTLDDWLVWQESLHPKAIDLGLARVRQVFQRLELPKLPFTLTVGGTNGKGSCVALLDAILRAEGYRVGTYTSPHLLRYNERIRIDGVSTDDDVLCAAFQRIDEARGDTSLSFFEFGTLAALDIFSKAGLDVQILEVGLGGRLDAVNLVDADGALIASIDIDHQDWLGDTRAAIALEKAGIFRAGRPAIVGDPQPPDELLAHAQAAGIALACQGRDFHFTVDGTCWSWQGAGWRLDDLPRPAVKGDHQLLNASAVLQLLTSVRPRLPVSETAVRRGLTEVSLPGRFQYLDDTVPVLLDVAHNSQSVRILADYLAREFPGRAVRAVFAIMRDKDIDAVIAHIRPQVRHWYLAPLKMPRAADEALLREALGRAGVESVRGGFPDAAAAFAAASCDAAEGDLIVVFGSFFLVSEYLTFAS
jgi:dihydrofolate synthase/folylpolyglutamate synthase